MRFKSLRAKAVQKQENAVNIPSPTPEVTKAYDPLLGNGDKQTDFQKEDITFAYPDDWKLDQVDVKEGSVSLTTPDKGKLKVYYKGIPKGGVKRECKENMQEEEKQVSGKISGAVTLNTCSGAVNDANLVFSGKGGGGNVTVVYEFPKSDKENAKSDFDSIIDTINNGSSSITPSPTPSISHTTQATVTPSLSGENVPSSTPTPTSAISNPDIIPDCSNVVLNLTVKAPFPSESWYCLSKIENSSEGWIDVKSDLFTIRISNLARGPVCGENAPELSECKISPFYSNKITDLYTYNYLGEDREIFGILNYKYQTGGSNKTWQVIVYEGMDERKLTQSEKDELTKVLDAILQLNP